MHKVQTKGINSLRAPSRVLAIVSTLSHPSQKWGFVICHPCAKDSNAEAGPGLIQQDPCWDWDLFGIPKQSWECRKSLLQLPHTAFPPGIASAAQIAAGLLPWEVSGVMMGAQGGTGAVDSPPVPGGRAWILHSWAPPPFGSDLHHSPYPRGFLWRLLFPESLWSTNSNQSSTSH